MKSCIGCIPCFVTQTVEAVRQVTADSVVQERVIKQVLRLIAGMDMNEMPPVMGQKIHRIIRAETGNADPYRQIKKHYNQWAESVLPGIVDAAEKQCDRFESSLRLSIAGNIIDFGKHGNLTDADVMTAVERCFDAPIDKAAVKRLRREIEDSHRILYLGDNTGEIVFDRLFLAQLPLEKVVFAVRGRPIINDATMEDAEAVGLARMVKVIDNGSDAPGTVLSDCSSEFRDVFERADLIISKGQGNYETLSACGKNIFFLLQAKCAVIAEALGCRIGDYIVKQGGRA